MISVKLISDLKPLQENSLKFLSSRMWLFDALRRTQKIIPKTLFNKGIKKQRLKFNLGLALNGLPTTGPLCLAVCMTLLVALKLKPTQTKQIPHKCFGYFKMQNITCW